VWVVQEALVIGVSYSIQSQGTNKAQLTEMGFQQAFFQHFQHTFSHRNAQLPVVNFTFLLIYYT
jgi:hypothetical protein